MSDKNGTTTTTTMWQDKHSGLRRHKLMTKELGEKIPALYANENVENTDDVMAQRQAVLSLQRLALVRHRVGRRRPANASASSRGSRRSGATST